MNSYIACTVIVASLVVIVIALYKWTPQQYSVRITIPPESKYQSESSDDEEESLEDKLMGYTPSTNSGSSKNVNRYQKHLPDRRIISNPTHYKNKRHVSARKNYPKEGYVDGRGIRHSPSELQGRQVQEIAPLTRSARALPSYGRHYIKETR